jgi:hypothetical protein
MNLQAGLRLRELTYHFPDCAALVNKTMNQFTFEAQISERLRFRLFCIP